MAEETSTTDPVHAAMVVLYDSMGAIAHVHYVEADSADDLPDQTSLEQAARTHAGHHTGRGRPFDPAKTQALHVNPQDFKMDRQYKVDTKKRALVEAAPERSSTTDPAPRSTRSSAASTKSSGGSGEPSTGSRNRSSRSKKPDR